MHTKKSSPDDFRQILHRLSRQHDLRRVFDAFTRLAACALAAQTREAEYLEEAKQWERPELDLFAEALGALISEMESHPFEDILGGYYMEFAVSQKGQKWNGEFHTPKPVCDLMARITLGDMTSLPVEGPITICEPACGAGAMVLSLAQACPPEARRRLRVTAMDINRTACDMTFINTTLWGIPTRIIHGNTISMECWAAWSNIHYIAPWLPFALRPQSPEATEQGQSPKPAEVEPSRLHSASRNWRFNSQPLQPKGLFLPHPASPDAVIGSLPFHTLHSGFKDPFTHTQKGASYQCSLPYLWQSPRAGEFGV